ncbi:MAG: acetylxylan esterase [bacterium]|nr:acetylxylan esterase [bacterium]
MFRPFLDGYYDVEDQLPEYVKRRAFEYFQKEEIEKNSIKSIEEFEKRKEKIRDYFIEAIGGLDIERTELNPVYAGVIEKDSYIVKKVIYQSIPNFYVTSNLYMPKDIDRKIPAILFACGHWESAKACPEYQKVCIELVKNGFIVLAVDPIGQGERMQYYDRELKRTLIRWGTMEHSYAGLQCTLVGANIARYFIWDLIRAIDLLESLSEVDPTKIGLTGNSGGGTQSSYLMLIEPRIKVAVPCTYITSREEYMKTGQAHDSEQNIFNAIAMGLNYDDFISCFAPKPVMIGAVDSDFFCIEGVINSYERAKKIYRLYGKEENIKLHVAKGTHSYNDELRQEAVRWFVKHLKCEETVNISENLEIEREENLRCTQTGQVLAEFDSAKDIPTLNYEYFEKRAERISDKEKIREKLLEVLNIPKDNKPLYPRIIGEGIFNFYNSSLKYKKIFMFPEKDIATAGVYIEGKDKRMCTLLLLNEGTNDIQRDFDLIRQFLSNGDVFVFDPRGVGSVRCRDINLHGFYEYYGTEYKLNFDLMMLGTSMTALRVFDILRAIECVKSFNPDIDVAIAGKGISAIYALFASVIDKGIKEVYLEDLLYSYRELISTKYYRYDPRIEIYGIARYFDIEDLILSLNDRKITLVNPRNAKGEIANIDKLGGINVYIY